MRRFVHLLVLLVLSAAIRAAGPDMTWDRRQMFAPDDADETISGRLVNADYLKYNWFVQGGLDMSLQNPYGYDFSNVFPNGRSFGVNASVGRWFTPEIGLRARVNWENGIGLFENNDLIWLAPFNQPGENMRRGGYLSLVGDIMFDLNSMLIGTGSTGLLGNRWHVQPFLRAGGVMNYGTDKGAPLIGVGISNRINLNNRRLSLYVDAAYNGVSSGFTMDPSTATGVGTGGNMYFDLDVGITYRFRGQLKSWYSRGVAGMAVCWDDRPSVRPGGSFFKDWFLQFSLDQTLYNLCETDFSESFSKGRTGGVNFAVGKWFSEQIGMRGRVNWENGLGIFKNDHLEWIPYDATLHDSNMDGGGCMLITADLLLDLKGLFLRWQKYYDEWFTFYAIGRMGLSSNRSLKSASPLVGLGAGTRYRITDRVSLFAESTYQGTTSEYFSGISWSGPTGGAFNGIWDFCLGVQLNIGERLF
ncbi:MAG: hypothetical protein MJY79_02720 [Bacteroidaceae bacterium]|nr:hypothetical protein [Bacteroidaceae bacterium]